MDFTIDRSLPIPVRQQLKGLIEFAVACGELRPGEALPSVRDLAHELGIAPMTVSQTYADLKGLGLLTTRAGAGTFVTESSGGNPGFSASLTSLHRQIDQLIDDGLALGLRTADLASLINARLAGRARHGRHKSIAIVGLFQRTTARYAKLLAAQVGPSATVEPTTIASLQRYAIIRSRIAASDLVVTFFNKRNEVASLLPGAHVTAIHFIPAEETRDALAAIPDGHRVLLLARVAEFLPIMKAGVMRFARGVGTIQFATDTAEEIASAARSVDSVIFASGTETSLQYLPAGMHTIEYKHVPDPGDIRTKIESILSTGPDRKANAW
ncbi:GntR family transcriptional regulator [Bosea thiooxidans]|nr:GntR family transcriptional regulator [Bosea sp. (in: a-proteobacteria)]